MRTFLDGILLALYGMSYQCFVLIMRKVVNCEWQRLFDTNKGPLPEFKLSSIFAKDGSTPSIDFRVVSYVPILKFTVKNITTHVILYMYYDFMYYFIYLLGSYLLVRSMTDTSSEVETRIESKRTFHHMPCYSLQGIKTIMY